MQHGELVDCVAIVKEKQEPFDQMGKLMKLNSGESKSKYNKITYTLYDDGLEPIQLDVWNNDEQYLNGEILFL